MGFFNLFGKKDQENEAALGKAYERGTGVKRDLKKAVA